MAKKKTKRSSAKTARSAKAGTETRSARARGGTMAQLLESLVSVPSVRTDSKPTFESAVTSEQPSARSRATELWKRGLLGVGYGLKESAGALTPTIGLRVYVRAKRTLSSLSSDERVPALLYGGTVQTDVVAVGSFKPIHWKDPTQDISKRRWKGPEDVGRRMVELSDDQIKDMSLLRAPMRPLLAGVSLGPDIPETSMAGSLGALVKSGGRTCILSNNHVLADSTLSTLNQSRVRIGDQIFQPGTLDRSMPHQLALMRHNGSVESTPVGQLRNVVPIKPSNPETGGAPAVNLVDAALAEVDASLAPVAHGVFSMPPQVAWTLPSDPDPNKLFLRTVAKVGRTTAATLGVVVDVNVRSWIPYGHVEDDLDRYAWFEQQLGIMPIGGGLDFSDSGDSGSGVFDPLTCELVGLLFAGSTGFTLVNPIRHVIDALHIDSLA